MIRPPQADPLKIGNSKQRTITLEELYANANRADNYCVYSTYITGNCCIMGHLFLLIKQSTSNIRDRTPIALVAYISINSLFASIGFLNLFRSVGYFSAWRRILRNLQWVYLLKSAHLLSVITVSQLNVVSRLCRLL